MSDSSMPQVALVTGASRGIGRAIATALAAQGFKVVGTATTADGALSIGDALAAAGGQGLALNVNDAAAVEAAVDGIVKAHGGLHVLVNNAGITRDTLAMRMKDDDWDAVLDTNLKAVFRLSRAVMRTMMKQRYGRIINITSVVGASNVSPVTFSETSFRTFLICAEVSEPAFALLSVRSNSMAISIA